MNAENLIAVTNRKLTENDFLEQVCRIADTSPKAIVLREKDLKESEYEALAKEVISICEKRKVPLFLHYFYHTAIRLSYSKIHVSVPILKEMEKEDCLSSFSWIGVSVHSREEALYAEKKGASYLFAGHIFETDCKKGVPPKGLDFLKEIVESVTIPVYAIGGIRPDHLKEVLDCKAAGAAMMSGFMKL